jgi:hypothetical protein
MGSLDPVMIWSLCYALERQITHTHYHRRPRSKSLGQGATVHSRWRHAWWLPAYDCCANAFPACFQGTHAVPTEVRRVSANDGDRPSLSENRSGAQLFIPITQAHRLALGFALKIFWLDQTSCSYFARREADIIARHRPYNSEGRLCGSWIQLYHTLSRTRHTSWL